MSIVADIIQYHGLPPARLLKILILALETRSNPSYFRVLVLQIDFVFSKGLNFPNQVILVRLGVRFVCAIQLSLDTSATGLRSYSVTLRLEKASK